MIGTIKTVIKASIYTVITRDLHNRVWAPGKDISNKCKRKHGYLRKVNIESGIEGKGAGAIEVMQTRQKKQMSKRKFDPLAELRIMIIKNVSRRLRAAHIYKSSQVILLLL